MDDLEERAQSDLKFIIRELRSCRKAGAFKKVRPLFIKQMPIQKDAKDHPISMLDCLQLVVREVFDCHFVPGEFPVEILWIYYASLYYGQVCNGGHQNLTEVVPYGPIPMRLSKSGFEAIGQPQLSHIVDDYISIISDPNIPTNVDVFGEDSPCREKLWEIDSALFKIKHDDVMTPLGVMGQSLSCFEFCSDLEACSKRLGELKKTHPYMAARGRKIRSRKRRKLGGTGILRNMIIYEPIKSLTPY
ncbi:hypothetical protein N9M10_02020 [Hellea sp.]|nr:hypothetical protein [Hellea sp.]